MTSPHDDLDMSAGRDLDDRLVEDLLRGRTTPRSLEQQHLAAAIAALQDVSGVAPRPDAELQRLFAEGLTPPAAAPAPVPQRRAAWRGLGLRPLAARVAGLSLAFKLLLAGTAVAATALGGAGVAGVLPGQADRDPDAIHPEIEPEGPVVGDDAVDPEDPGEPGSDDTSTDATAPPAPQPSGPDAVVPHVRSPGDRDDGDGPQPPDAPVAPNDQAPTPSPAPAPGAPPVTGPTEPPAPDATPPPSPAPPSPPEDPTPGPDAGSGAPGPPPSPPEAGDRDGPGDPPEPPDRGDEGAARAPTTP